MGTIFLRLTDQFLVAGFESVTCFFNGLYLMTDVRPMYGTFDTYATIAGKAIIW